MRNWIDQGPFHGIFVNGTGVNQITYELPLRVTFLESLADLDEARKLGERGLDFIRNGNGASVLPSKVRPPPEQRKK